MPNFVRKLRQALGLSQTEFGRAIGRSYQSVQSYEAEIPREVLEKMRELALEHALAEIAEEISSQTDGASRPTVASEQAVLAALEHRLASLEKTMREGFARLEAAPARTPPKLRMRVHPPGQISRRRGGETK